MTRLKHDRGRKPGLVMRDALALELAREDVGDDGAPIARSRLIARKLLEKARAGDLLAMKIVWDRADGRAGVSMVPEGEAEKIEMRWMGDEEAEARAAKRAAEREAADEGGAPEKP